MLCSMKYLQKIKDFKQLMNDQRQMILQSDDEDGLHIYDIIQSLNICMLAKEYDVLVRMICQQVDMTEKSKLSASGGENKRNPSKEVILSKIMMDNIQRMIRELQKDP